MNRKTRIGHAVSAALAITGLGLAACSPLQRADGCDRFRAAERNPIVQAALPAGEVVAGAALGAVTGGLGAPVPGIAVAAVKAFGDNYCATGAPANDTTTPAEREQWISAVADKLVETAKQK